MTEETRNDEGARTRLDAAMGALEALRVEIAAIERRDISDQQFANLYWFRADLFGRKDLQQLAIVRRMVADLDLGVEILAVPIVREHDGLALSSRNVRLSPPDRAAAVVLSQALFAGCDLHRRGERRAATIVEHVTDRIRAEPRADLEYVELVDACTLRTLDTVDVPAALLTAASFGEVRLIDNVTLEPPA